MQHLSLELLGFEVKEEQIKKLTSEVNDDFLKTNKYNKSGNGDYIPVNIYRRLMNEVFNHKWSWEILRETYEPNIETAKYVKVTGRLHIPGIGFRDGIGAAKLDKADNSASFSSAASYAFKNAVKSTGLAANLLEDDWDEDLFEGEYEEEVKPVRTEQSSKKETVKANHEFSDEQKGFMAELREIYQIKNNKQMIALFQVWDSKIESLSTITPSQLNGFIEYYEEHEEEFEDFNAELVK